jgi:hypothetical protein
MKNTVKLILLLAIMSLLSCKKYGLVIKLTHPPKVDTTTKVTIPLAPTPPSIIDNTLVGTWLTIFNPNQGHTVEEGPSLETLIFAASGIYKSTINGSYLGNPTVRLDSGTYSVGHGNYETYTYDSIAYYHKDSICRVDYYQIINDTLTFTPAFKGEEATWTESYHRQ